MIFPPPRLLALFQKRFAGDDALLELARRCFTRAGLGPEFYAADVAELAHLFAFRPGGNTPVVVHLSRAIDLFTVQSRRQTFDFAAISRGQAYGFVVHDQSQIATRLSDYAAYLAELDRGLHALGPAPPYLFIEYAAGLEPDLFCELFEKIKELPQISACLDIGHLGIWQANEYFRSRHPGRDIWSLIPSSPELPALIADVQAAVESALPAVIKTIRMLAALGKPLHFHLHDGHPLAASSSPFRVSDHLSFFSKISLPFSFQEKTTLAPMFGPAGLARILAAALETLNPGLLSFTLEIHPVAGRTELGSQAQLFAHWRDKTNAERMNRWLDVLLKNQELLRQALLAVMTDHVPHPDNTCS